MNRFIFLMLKVITHWEVNIDEVLPKNDRQYSQLAEAHEYSERKSMCRAVVIIVGGPFETKVQSVLMCLGLTMKEAKFLARNLSEAADKTNHCIWQQELALRMVEVLLPISVGGLEQLWHHSWGGQNIYRTASTPDETSTAFGNGEEQHPPHTRAWPKSTPQKWPQLFEANQNAISRIQYSRNDYKCITDFVGAWCYIFKISLENSFYHTSCSCLWI